MTHVGDNDVFEPEFGDLPRWIQYRTFDLRHWSKLIGRGLGFNHFDRRFDTDERSLRTDQHAMGRQNGVDLFTKLSVAGRQEDDVITYLLEVVEEVR